jgi:hypothetical protein
MKKRCIINFAKGSWYPHGQKRLIVSLKEQNYAKNREYNINKIMTENKFQEEQRIIKEHNYSKNREHTMNKIMTNYQNKDIKYNTESKTKNVEENINEVYEQDNKSNIKIVDVYNTDSQDVKKNICEVAEKDIKIGDNVIKNTNSKDIEENINEVEVSEQDIIIDNVYDKNNNSENNLIEFPKNNLDDSLFGIGEKICQS